MRITVLRTDSTSCAPIYSWLRRDNIVSDIVYDTMPHHHLLPAMVEEERPDWVLMFGCSDADGANVPGDEVLAHIHHRHKFVHLCCDGSEKIWWPQLDRYYKHRCFDLQINIDGVEVGPIGKKGMTTVCPIEPSSFPQIPWAERPIKFGFRGGYGNPNDARTQTITGLQSLNLLHAELRDRGGLSYQDFMSSCQCVLNHAETGTADHMHVKARVLEAAFAGCVLFENAGSPTEKWFRPDIDYLPYENIEDIRLGLKLVEDNPEDAECMVQNFRERAMQYSAEHFWRRVMAHIGVQELCATS